MPAVVVAAAATAAGTAVATAALGAAAAGTLGFALLSAGVAAVVSFAGASLLGLNKRPNPASVEPFAAENQGRQVILRSAVTPRRVIYGEAVLSGPLMYACKSGAEPDPWLHLVIALAGHECDSITGVFLGEDEITSAQIGSAGYVTSGKYAVAVPVARVKTGTVPATPWQVTADYTVSSVQSVTITREYNNEDGAVPYDVVLHDGDGYSLSGSVFTFDARYEGEPYTINYTEATSESYVRIKRYLGTATQSADADLIAASAAGDNGRWTAAHQGRGLAYIIVSLRRNNNLFPTGAPNIKARVKGKKLYDPRTATSVWSNNAALAVRDWLVSSYGLGCASAEIGSAIFNAAANVCDETVALSPAGDTQVRYTTDGVVSLDEAPLDVLERLLTSMAGAAIFSFGTWDVYAGAYQTPVHTIDESDLRGPVVVTPRPARKDLFNAVGGTYIDPATHQATSFRTQTNSTYEAQDGPSGSPVRIVKNIELPFVNNEVRAQRLAKIALEKSRQGRTIQWPGKMTVFRLNTWKTVNVSIDLLGLASHVHLVTGWKWSPHGGVDLTLQEEASTVYDWDYGDASTRDSAPDTNLPAANTAPGAPGAPECAETLVETTGSAGVKAQLTVTWGASAGPFVRDYFVEYKAIADSAYQRVRVYGGTTLVLYDLKPGYHLFRVAAINDLGVESALSGTVLKEVLGLTAPPADMSGAALSSLAAQQAELSWDKSTDLDVRIGGRVIWRWSPLTSGAAWNDGMEVANVPGDVTRCPVAHQSGTYMGKFRDSSGNESAASNNVVTTTPTLAGYNAVATLTEHSAFAGTKSATVVIDSKLTLDGAVLIDDMTDPIDDWGYIDTMGGVATTGTYDFASVVDLAAVYTCRVTAAIKTLSVDTDDLIDARLDPIDTWGLIDGPEISDVHARLYVATTEDNPSGSPTWSAWRPVVIGEYRARGLKFRLVLESNNQNHNIQVIELAVTVDMPDRIDSADDVASGTGTCSVAFAISPAFKTTPNVQITAQNMSTGDYYTITNKTATGFDIAFKNAGGSGVNRTFDWVAVGY